jgi:4-hydroxymandelate oxidase
VGYAARAMAGSPYLQVDDFEPVAREKLSPEIYEFTAGGAGDERTLAENLRAFERWVLRPRFLRGAGPPDASTEVLGERIAQPVLIAPWAFQRRAHPDGELATVRAAARARTVAVISSTNEDRIEEIAAAADAPLWWQLYLFVDEGRSAEMLARVVTSGYRAICWTVDLPVLGLRHRETRGGFSAATAFGEGEVEYESNLTWDHLGFIREHAPGLPVVVKGILTAEDAELAVQHGADGIVVSNHGGRQLDACPASLDALPEVAAVVDGRVPVLMDGGVRRGTDVVMTLALGADAVMIGRPAAWGLAAEGEDGVVLVLEILRAEIENAMALTGCGSVGEIGREFVAAAPGMTVLGGV